MSLDRAPFFERLDRARSILIAGAGGGFDVFAGLPIYFHLERAGKQVHLANLSFTNLVKAEGRRLNAYVVEVTHASRGPDYFPEGQLARWFASQGREVPIYALWKTGGRPLRLAYERLQQELGFDTVILVDGGTDILMRGDEAGLGTPQEDITSLAAVHSLPVEQKFVVCLGFGVDRYHGVCHAHFLENVAALSREGAFLGVTSLLAELPEAALFREAVTYACERTQHSPSIVGLSIVSAMDGAYGDVHSTRRTEGSRLWINPLMSMYWTFELGAVARRCLGASPADRDGMGGGCRHRGFPQDPQVPSVGIHSCVTTADCRREALHADAYPIQTIQRRFERALASRGHVRLGRRAADDL